MRKKRKSHLTDKKQRKERASNKWFRILIFFLTLLLMLVVWHERRYLHDYAKYGYFGIFIVNFLTSATVLFPLPGVATVFVGGAIWNPLIVGMISGVGSSIGELFAYFIGYGGRGLLKTVEHDNHWVRSVEDFFHRTGFVTTLIFSAIPFPFFDIVGIVAGALNYPLWKFILATLFGRTMRNVIVALSGAKILPI